MKKYHYEDVNQLKVHLQTFLLYYNFQKPLKALKYKNPWQMIEECYSEKPESFWQRPNDKNVGLNKYLIKINLYIKKTVSKNLDIKFDLGKRILSYEEAHQQMENFNL